MKALPKTNPEHSLMMYFQVHQPQRLSSFNFFAIGSDQEYFNDSFNEDIIKRVAKHCYLPTNTLLLKLISKFPGIRVAFSIPGTTLDLLDAVAPEALESFRALAATGSVEFLGETNYHSLASAMGGTEFEEQILEHSEKLLHYLGVRPTVFRNTELIYNDEIGGRISDMGFLGIISDGVEKALEGKSPHNIYNHPDHSDFKLLLRNYRLSDDIAFRFIQDGKPLEVDRYMSWLEAIPKDQPLVNLAMDYETFGEHQKKETGIFNFLENFLTRLAKQKKIKMVTPTEAIQTIPSIQSLSVPQFISWADQERDLSAWLGNDMQRDAFDNITKLESEIKKLDNKELLETWRHLLTSDHFYYMSTKKADDGTVHSYFSHYPSPYEAFINYMNIVSDFSLRVKAASKNLQSGVKKGAEYEYERQHLAVPEWAHKIENSEHHLVH